LSRTTLCGWVAEVATALTPIGDELRRQVTAASHLQTDDTPVTILAPFGGSHKGRLWTYLDPIGRQVVFDATPTHARDGPEAFLAAFAGDLQADAYTGYDALYATGRIREIGCWAHARRGFVEALTTDVRAALMVALIQQLYQVEHAAADVDADARRAVRQAESIPLLAKIAAERDALARSVLPKSRWAMRSGILRISGRRSSVLSTMGGSPSTIIAPRTSCAWSPSVERTGCLREVSKGLAGPPSFIHWSKAVRSWTSRRSSTSRTSCCGRRHIHNASSGSSRQKAGPRPSGVKPPRKHGPMHVASATSAIRPNEQETRWTSVIGQTPAGRTRGRSHHRRLRRI